MEPDRWAKVYRSCQWGERVIYIGAYIHNDHQAIPFGVFVADSLEAGETAIRQISLPAGLRPWDLLIRDQALYVLSDSASTTDRQVQVFRTQDLEKLTFALSFDVPTFARSFEILQDQLYFGLGGEWRDPEVQSVKGEQLPPCIGWILRTPLPKIVESTAALGP